METLDAILYATPLQGLSGKFNRYRSKVARIQPIRENPQASGKIWPSVSIPDNGNEKAASSTQSGFALHMVIYMTKTSGTPK